jgi:ribonuclease HI
MLILMCDGSSLGNPGKASIGVVVWQREPGTAAVRRFRPTHKISKDIGHGTNNEAEWTAVIEGLRYAKSIGYKGSIYVYTDSMLVVEQASGRWRIKDSRMLKYYMEYTAICRALKLNDYSIVHITWIPRQLTYLADKET